MIAGGAFGAFVILVAFSPSQSLHGPAYAQIDRSVAPGPSDSASRANAAPEFPSSETSVRSVDEDTPPYQNIGTPVTATDPDNDTLTYSLENASKSQFIIVESTGQLQTGAPLNYEAKSTYTVKVIATDPSGATGSITVSINVGNVNEPGKVALYWNQPQVSTALKATLTDPDGDVSGKTWVWEKSASNSGPWSLISEATSANYTPVVGDANNYLRATASYTDGEGSGKIAQAVSDYAARAAPATNSAPEFPSTEDGIRTIPENAEAGEAIGAPVVATDADEDPLTYSLGGEDATSFDIVASTGQLRTEAPLDYETKSSYTVTVTANDPSNAFATTTVTIAVTNMGEAGVGGVFGSRLSMAIMALGASLVGAGAIVRRRPAFTLPGWLPLRWRKRWWSRQRSRWSNL